MSERFNGPLPETTTTISVIDDDGNEIEVSQEDIWQYEQDAMRVRPGNIYEGEE